MISSMHWALSLAVVYSAVCCSVIGCSMTSGVYLETVISCDVTSSVHELLSDWLQYKQQCAWATLWLAAVQATVYMSSSLIGCSMTCSVHVLLSDWLQCKQQRWRCVWVVSAPSWGLESPSREPPPTQPQWGLQWLVSWISPVLNCNIYILNKTQEALNK